MPTAKPKNTDEQELDQFSEEQELVLPTNSKEAVSDEEREFLNSFETKIALAQKMITNLKNELMNLERLLVSDAEPADMEDVMRRAQTAEGDVMHPANEGKIVEGVFDGQNMIGSDGRLYMVPPNYASKSKLVEGDIMKLTIQPNGSFVYKQIGPIERQRIMGVLTKDEITADWRVIAEGKKFSVLTASVTYFKGGAGDDVVIMIPKAAPSKWAAIENIIKRD